MHMLPSTGMINQFLFGNSHGPVGGGPGGGGGAGAPGPSPNVLAEWSAMHRKPAFSELRENEGRIQVGFSLGVKIHAGCLAWVS